MFDDLPEHKKHAQEAIYLGQKLMAEGRQERRTHIIITVVLMIIVIFGCYYVIPELVIPISIMAGTVIIVYELKSQEIVLHSSISVLAGILEAFKKESLKQD